MMSSRARPERRHRDAGESEQVDRIIGARTGSPRRRHAQGQGHGDGENKARPEQQDRVAERRHQNVEHRLGVHAREAEVAAKRRHEPVAVALENGPVEAMQGAQARRVLGRHLGVGADHEVDGIARHQPDQRVNGKRHEGQHDGRLHEAVEEEAAHGRASSLKWQAAAWPGEPAAGSSAGAVRLQRSVAKGQRG